MNESIVYIHPKKLKPHERVSTMRAKAVLKKIQSDNHWTTPILVDKKSKVILDGHHRHHAALHMGCKKVPCIVCDYLISNHIQVFPRRKHIPVSKEIVVAQGLLCVPFPYKTTRHTLSVTLPEMAIPLSNLL